MVSKAQSNPQQDDNVSSQDSTVNVVAYFLKNDTFTYYIKKSIWILDPSDTIKAAGSTTKVRLTVSDSTSKGYKMEYSILEIKGDSVTDLNLGRIQNAILDNMGEDITGITVKFETDKFGAITKFNNLGQLKRQLKSRSDEIYQKWLQIPDIPDELKDYNINKKDLNRYLNFDKIVNDYLTELRLLFILYGNSYYIGESSDYEEAGDNYYEHETFTAATIDTANHTYTVINEVVNYIPQSKLMETIGDLVETMDNDSITEDFNKDINNNITEDAIHAEYYKHQYFEDGVPLIVIKQLRRKFNGSDQLTQTHIYLDY